MGHVRIRGSSCSSLDKGFLILLWMIGCARTRIQHGLRMLELKCNVGCDRCDRTHLDVPIGSHLQAETPLDT